MAILLVELALISYAITFSALILLAAGMWISDKNSDDRSFAIAIVMCLLPFVNIAFLAWMLYCLAEDLWDSCQDIKAQALDAWIRVKARARNEDNQDTRYL